MELLDKELRLARQAALSAFRSGRGIVSSDDLTGEANLWMAAHPVKVIAWREEGRHGENKLRHAARMHCLQVVAEERRKVSRFHRGDVAYYTPAVIRVLLPDVFDYNDWMGGAPAPTDQIRAASAPAEGNNRLAMLVDMTSTYVQLPLDDRVLLKELHCGGGIPFEDLALQYDCSERTVRRREELAIDRMVERLGGEPPWHHR